LISFAFFDTNTIRSYLRYNEVLPYQLRQGRVLKKGGENAKQEVARTVLLIPNIAIYIDSVLRQEGCQTRRIFNPGGKSYSLIPEAQEILIRKAEWLMAYPEINVIIQGHTDEPGTAEYNFALGDRRAGIVKSFLIQQGIDPSRLTAVSFGKERPAESGQNEEARAKNRRVHFLIE
jgi:outer membrane protein OmpA-like peptidoglycan-associated protein